MKREDAPAEGWYPDPSGGTRLRWWDGSDWADSWRSPALHVGAEIAEAAAAAGARVSEGGGAGGRPGSAGALAGAATNLQDLANQSASASRRDQERMLADMRRIARAEVDRVAGDFGKKAKEATAGLESTVKGLADEYGPQAMRWLRRGVIAIVIGWIVFNVLQAASGAAQMTLFEWLGERLDAWTSTTGITIGMPTTGGP